jgi:hypothetical protein
MGSSFTPRTTVIFDDVKAAPSMPSNSGKHVMATVPTHAKTGYITITTPRGTGKSNGIFVVMDDSQKERAAKVG